MNKNKKINIYPAIFSPEKKTLVQKGKNELIKKKYGFITIRIITQQYPVNG